MEIRYAARKFSSFENALSRQSEEFERLYPGHSVKIDFFEVEELYEAIRDLNSGYDVVMCSSDWMPEFINRGIVSALDPWFEQLPVPGWPEDYAPSLVKPQLGKGSNCYGVAYHDGPEMFYFRKDLFDNAAEKRLFLEHYGYPLAVPRTWEHFVDVARHFTRTEEGLYGTVIAAYPDGHNIVYDFILQLWSRGGQLFDEEMNPAFASQAGVAGLSFLVDLIHKHKVVPPNVFELDSIRAGEFYYGSGGAAMTWNWSHIASCAEIPEISTIVGRSDCTLIPSGDSSEGRHVSLISYYVNSITKTSSHPELAYRFLHVLASPAMDLVTTEEGAIGTRRSTWRSPEVLRSFPFYAMIDRIHDDVRSTPQMEEYPAINGVLNHWIHEALRGNVAAEAALQNAVRETRAILKRSGAVAPFAHEMREE